MNAVHRLMGAFMASLVVLFSSGCASLKEEGGYIVQPKSAKEMRQEPWHNVTLMGDIRKVETVAVAPYNLPEPVPLKWEQELVDQGRAYAVQQGDRLVRKPLVRVVERALLYDDSGKLLELFDAVFFPDHQRFYALLPTDRAGTLIGKHMVIVSSDGTWLMTGQKKIVTLPPGQDLRQLPSGFFREHPSELRQVIPLKRPDPLLMELTWRFDEHFVVQGVPYSGQRGAVDILGQFTGLNTALDRVVSCGSFTVAPGMIPISVAVSLVRNVYVASQEDCLASKKN